MTQEIIIEALQNGPMTSEELCRLTGLPKSAVLSAAKKLRYKGDLTTEEVKVGRYWMAKYTLVENLVKPEDKDRCLLNPFDIRNAKGIFSKAEYAVMNSQARRLLGNPDFTKDITNYQTI